MARKVKLTDEQRIRAVKEYLEGEGSYERIAKKNGIAIITFRNYVRRAKAEGIDKLCNSRKNKKYSKATKLAAVEEYLAGKGSLSRICTTYKISDTKTLRAWIKCYNSGKDFKERSSSERGVTMKKGRKTTLEERVEIVAFCIANGKDFVIEYNTTPEALNNRKTTHLNFWTIYKNILVKCVKICYNKITVNRCADFQRHLALSAYAERQFY